jgi:predicted nucleotidyltransferase
MKSILLRNQDLNALQAICRRCPKIAEMRIFGSRATGTARRASDIDLAVFAPEASAKEWADFCEALENAPIIYELDLVRTEQNTNKRLREKIAREGVTIYPVDP